MKSNTPYYIVLLFACISVAICACGTKTFQQGKKLYENNCSSCHQANGEGLAKLYPPLKGSDYWVKNQTSLPCIIRYGLKDTILVNGITYNSHMAGLPKLSDAEISNIINYINQEWYEGMKSLEAKDLKEQFKQCDIK